MDLILVNLGLFICSKNYLKLQMKSSLYFVFSHPLFVIGSFKGLLQPFLNFMEMFQCEKLIKDQLTAKKFYNSVSIVITKSQQKVQRYLYKIQSLISFLQNNKNIDSKHEVIKALLKSILINKRLVLFEQGKDGFQLPRSSILEQLSSEKNWEYYDLEKEKISRDDLIKLSYQKSFQNISEKDNQSYKIEISQKEQFMRKSYQLLGKFIKKGIDNWYGDHIDYDEEFNSLEQLIRDHPYGNFQPMINFLQIQFTIPQKQEKKQVTRINLINQIKKIKQFTDILEISSNQQSHIINKLQKMYQPLQQIFDTCRKTFCKNRHQEQKFIIFTFINMRNQYQSQIQTKIDLGQSSSIPFIITGGLSELLPEPIWDLLPSFLIGFQPKTNYEEQYYLQLIQECLTHTDILQPEKVKQLIQLLIKNYLKKIDVLTKQYKEQDWIKFTKKIEKRLEIMENYLQFLEQSEEKQKIRELYERMIDQFKSFPQKKIEWKEKLNKLLVQQQRSLNNNELIKQLGDKVKDQEDQYSLKQTTQQKLQKFQKDHEE